MGLKVSSLVERLTMPGPGAVTADSVPQVYPETLRGGKKEDYDRYMNSATNTWPPELLAFVRSSTASMSGDRVATLVATWVSLQP
jgi:hypothetical protein